MRQYKWHYDANDERPPAYHPDTGLEPDSIDQHGNRYPNYEEYEHEQKRASSHSRIDWPAIRAGRRPF